MNATNDITANLQQVLIEHSCLFIPHIENLDGICKSTIPFWIPIVLDTNDIGYSKLEYYSDNFSKSTNNLERHCNAM